MALYFFLLGWVCTFIGLGTTTLFWRLASIRKREAKYWEDRSERLSFAIIDYEDITKRLEIENQTLLLGPPPKLPVNQKIEELLEVICDEMEITGIFSESHGEETMDSKFHGLGPLVTYEFNNGLIKIRELVDHPEDWKIDLIYKNELVAGLLPSHREKLRKMLIDKIAEAALKDLRE